VQQENSVYDLYPELIVIPEDGFHSLWIFFIDLTSYNWRKDLLSCNSDEFLSQTQ